ncbi:MAG: alkaline phosphatase D family protein [Planctomycetota bacterium]|nr:alkaline phosphatase D family protein [Planctomycetota bacterium]
MSGLRTFLAGTVLALSIVPPASGAPEPSVPQAPDGFQSSWALDHDRTWVGSAFHANRWQDWRVRDGRLECTEVAERLPMRTVQVLTETLDPKRGPIRLRVSLGEIELPSTFSGSSRAGLIIGCGGPGIDYRLTALVHHQPAPDGGLVVLVDEHGSVTIRSNEQSVPGASKWVITGDVTDDDLPLLSSPAEPAGATPSTLVGVDGFELTVEITGAGPSYRVDARVHDAEGTTPISHAVAKAVPLRLVEGGFGVVSNHGPSDSSLGWWFRGLSARGEGVVSQAMREFGPVLGTLYTLDGSVVKMTAQFPPLGDRDRWSASLQVQTDPRAGWETVATAPIDRDSRTAHFRVEGWRHAEPVPYRVAYALSRRDGTLVANDYRGVIRPQPAPESPLLVASLSCHKTFTGGLAWNPDGLWFPNERMVAALVERDPDLVFFAGDQIYEGDLTPARQRTEDAYILDYLWKYTHWHWAFNDLLRDRPAVVIPDDHDVYHGNIWGAGGRRAVRSEGRSAQDSGGYKRPPRFVNAVHRTQVGHLPDPERDEPIGAGYTTYHTSFQLGGVSFAVIADRQYKESPSVAVPEGKVRNGWFTAEGFDVVTDGDPRRSPLLGPEQEAFLEEWISDWTPTTWMKVLLSQTPFACVQTLPEGAAGGVQPGLTVFPVGGYPRNDVPCADADSNGWPMHARDRTLDLLRPAQPLHLCGDQHLAFVAQYGVDRQRDSGVVFCSPAIANTWPRRWMPRNADGAPDPLGEHVDGFGNLVAVDAVANPFKTNVPPIALNDRCPGYGLALLDPVSGTITLEAWPRWSAGAERPRQFAGWPRTYRTHALLESAWSWQLPLEDPRLAGLEHGALVELRDAGTDQLVRIMRLSSDAPGSPWRVPAPGDYSVRITAPSSEEPVRFLMPARRVPAN